MTSTVAALAYRMKNPFSLTYAIAHRFRMRVGEWSLAFAMLLAGLVLMMKDQTFALSPYVVLRTMAPEET